MTYKQIEASRELRLWIGQVIVPAVTMAVALASIPEVRNTASRKLEELKWKFKSRSKGGAGPLLFPFSVRSRPETVLQ